ncbi:unnamed protein product [Schistocephalus solidus]|uniref:Secreted protein n=1 Tax=Schistocephalus solidus TaxID=70667 RepID=A0A183SLA3_SCHSO|nr:unnamed protein product [Schistocephalus solidus]
MAWPDVVTPPTVILLALLGLVIDVMLNFADQNRLFVTNTGFQHHNKHLLTWYSNDGHTTSQIDYILVSSRFRSWVHDSRSMCGAETGNAYGSGHVLVHARLKVHLASAPKISSARRLDVAKIRQPGTAEALHREIRSFLLPEQTEKAVISGHH